LAWIELHQNVISHPKLYALADRLKVDRMQALGHLCALWLWAVDNAEDGDLSPFGAEAIAEAARWRRRPQVFVDGLRAAGWIDESGAIHRWWSYAGKLVDKRRRDRARKRPGFPGDVPRNSSGSPTEVAGDSDSDRTATVTVPVTDGPRDASGWFILSTGRHPDGMEANVLAGIDASHPEECIRWAFERAATAQDRWRYAKVVLDACYGEHAGRHGPRDMPRNGRQPARQMNEDRPRKGIV
jgi:hypothetical protein